ncbi:protein SpAN-like [Panulirus ornatus]|uniref:protein SpAN-like n=1 Tax=Panulirus ornatus TaxID=150431 RepID=UPI003A87A695
MPEGGGVDTVMRTPKKLILLPILLWHWSLMVAGLETGEDLEVMAYHLPLSPAQVPDGANPLLEVLVSKLPLELLNPRISEDKHHLLEGDIIVTRKQWKAAQRATAHDLARKAVSHYARLWPVDPNVGWPTVHYQLASSLSQPEKIRGAMDELEEKTCVRFVEVTDGNYDRHFVKFIEGRGCYSRVGMTRKKSQLTSIGPRCRYRGIILHELSHVLGLYHEQSRADRNTHIKVLVNNMKKRSRRNFVRESTRQYGIEYDFTSLMHYGSTAFSKNGRPTIVTKDPAKQIYLGHRSSLTFRDVHILNQMYNCSETWGASCIMRPKCENGGYLNASCSCACPPGTSGDTCATVTHDYYPVPECGGNVTESGAFITSPNYPKNYPKGARCAWWVRAPDDCHSPVLTVKDFVLFSKASNRQCVWDRLEVRTESIMDGDEYCGKDLKTDQTLVGKDRDIFLFFTSKLKWRRGFKFEVSFKNKCHQLCETNDMGDNISWTSPRYPASYPGDLRCRITITKTLPTRLMLVFNSVSLPTNCSDSIRITSAHGSVTEVCGTTEGSLQLPGSYHSAIFTSGSENGTQGWAVTFSSMESQCHKVVTLSEAASQGSLKTPNFPKNYPKNTQCEWWIKAPAGKKVMLRFRILRLATNSYRPNSPEFKRRFYQKMCHRGYVLVSPTGDPSYPRGGDASLKLCGYRENDYNLTSTGSEVSLLFWGGTTRTQGMWLDYSLM